MTWIPYPFHAIFWVNFIIIIIILLIRPLQNKPKLQNSKRKNRNDNSSKNKTSNKENKSNDKKLVKLPGMVKRGKFTFLGCPGQLLLDPEIGNVFRQVRRY